MNSKIYIMGVFTLVGFPAIGLTIIGFVENNPWSFNFNWFEPMHWGIQICLGLLFGLVAGIWSWWLINRPSLKQIKIKYGTLINQLDVDFWAILFLSFAAGVGEEFLFRGIFQTYWGVWITAIIFVAIHGYLDPRDGKMMIYGISMTIIIVIFGYLKIHVGLLTPMAAHFMVDVFLLSKLTTDADLTKLEGNVHSQTENLQSTTVEISENES